MEAKEFMLNDLVYRKEHEEFHKPVPRSVVKIDGVENNDMITFAPNSEFLDMDEIEPISLTAKILEKNEFEIEPGKSHDYGYTDEDIWIYGETMIYYPKGLMDSCSKFVFNDDCQILEINLNYVHELQHALRLVGLNEVADNLKI